MMQWKKLKKKIRRFCRYIYTRFVFRRFDVLKVRNFKRISAVANKLEPHDFRVLYERKIWRKSKSLQINLKIGFLANISSLNLFLKSITRYLLELHLKCNCSSWVFSSMQVNSSGTASWFLDFFGLSSWVQDQNRDLFHFEKLPIEWDLSGIDDAQWKKFIKRPDSCPRGSIYRREQIPERYQAE